MDNCRRPWINRLDNQSDKKLNEKRREVKTATGKCLCQLGGDV